MVKHTTYPTLTPYVSINGKVTKGPRAAAAFHAVEGKKLTSITSFDKSNSEDISVEAVVMEVAFSPIINVTQTATLIVAHFCHGGQLNGLEGCRDHSGAFPDVRCVETECD